jgi:SCY1-like protein 1
MASWLGKMWGGSSASLPYNIESSPTSPATRHGSHGWAMHAASKKTDDYGEVTAFQANKADLAKSLLRRSGSQFNAQYTDTSQTQLLPALHHFHRIKRLIHPRILRAHATLDTDYPDETKPAPGLDNLDKTLATGTLIIVTEQCKPLDDWLELLDPRTSASNAAAISWGIYNIVEALDFLHSNAKLAHGMVCPDAIFVTPSGDFKLGGFDLITPLGVGDGASSGGPTPHFNKFEGAVCPHDYRSPERVSGRYDLLQQSAPVHSIDCFSLAVTIEYIYSHPNAGTNGQVPPPLQKALARMKNDAPKLRPRLAPLLKCPVFDNPHVKAEKFLDEVMSKPIEEKIMFLQSLPDVLNRGVLNKDVAIHKILPLLVMGLRTNAGNETAMTQDVNRREVLAIVPLLFQIAESYLAGTSELFQRHVAPLVPILFSINDRGVRGAVLQKISLLEGQLDNSTINSAVFEPMCSGFTDSSGPLRELTLKATICLVPKLNYASMEKLVRYLIRLQSDPEASIRTNTVIFIGKIAPNLSDMSRQKLILPAFMRSMKDPFTPCRLSALRLVISCLSYFPQKDVAEKVLPAVIPHTLDAAPDVRVEAFKVVDALLVGLREESQKMAKDEADRISAATCGMNAQSVDKGSGGGIAAAPNSGNYLSGLWSATTTTEGTPRMGGAAVDRKMIATNNNNANNGPAVPPTSRSPAAPKFSSLSLSDAQIGGASNYGNGDDGGWSDDDVDISGSSPAKSAVGGWNDLGGKSPMDDEDGDDFFASFDSKPKSIIPGGGKSVSLGTRKLSSGASSITTASKAAPQMQPSGMVLKKQQPKPVVKKLPTSSDMDGWDDF